MLVRYVNRDNTNPKLAILIPHIILNYVKLLYLVIIPTVEDIRDY